MWGKDNYTSEKKITKSIRRPNQASSEQRELAEVRHLLPGFRARAQHAPSGPGAGFPYFVVRDHAYADRITLGDGAVYPDLYTLRANSTYDPDETGTGHQPKGRDTMAAIYNSYAVLRCHYRVRFITNGAARKLVGIVLTSSATLSSDFDTVSEILEACHSNNVRCAWLPGTGDEVNYMRTIEGSVDLADYILDSGTPQDEMAAAVGANPAFPIRMHIWAINEDGSPVAADNVIVHYDLTYRTVWFEPNGTFTS